MSYAISYGCSLLAFALLPLLPDQKAQAQHRKATWPSSPLFGIFSVVLLVVAFSYSIVITLLGLSPKTQCLKIAGGEGCGS